MADTHLTDTEGASAVPDAVDEDETLIVNSLPVTFKKGIHAKTIISIYCQQNKLVCPVYSNTLVNPNDPEWKNFYSRFDFNSKRVIGSGKSPQKAEKAAARKYLNNNFMSGENSPQTEIPVSSSKENKPPKQTRKENRRLEKFLQKKKEEEEARRKADKVDNFTHPEHDPTTHQNDDSNTPDVSVAMGRTDIIALVFFDLERAAGQALSEIIQLGFCSNIGEGIYNIIPKGKICRVAAKMSHNIYFNGTNLVRHGKVLRSVTMKEAADEFIAFLKNVMSESGLKPILVCHGSDMVTLLNNFAEVKKDMDLIDNISGSVNFLNVIEDDENYPAECSMSLTKINPVRPNLSQTVLREDFNKDENKEAHDALYDSKLLMRVVQRYCSEVLPVDMLVDTYLEEASKLISHVQGKVSASMRKKKKAESQFYTFNGWQLD